MTITVTCPSCVTTFPVDPRKIPEGGVNARCSACRDIFFVGRPEAHTGSTAAEPTPDEVTPVAPVSREGEKGEGDVGAREGEEGEGDVGARGAQEGEKDVAAGEAGEGEREAEATGAREEGVPDAPGSFDLEDPGAGMGGIDEASLDREVRDIEGQDADSQEARPSQEADTQEVEGRVDDAAATTDDWSIGGVEDWDEHGEAPAAPDELRSDAAGEVVSESEIAQPSQPEEGQAPETVPTPAEPPQGFQLGRRDPHEKARRLARVLVSDMIMYNPERHARALENHTLREDFDEEIKKSWEEYVEQVGQEIAGETAYFRDALNEILARGEQVFDGNP